VPLFRGGPGRGPHLGLDLVRNVFLEGQALVSHVLYLKTHAGPGSSVWEIEHHGCVLCTKRLFALFTGFCLMREKRGLWDNISLWQRILNCSNLPETQPRKWSPLHLRSRTPPTCASGCLRSHRIQRASAPSNMYVLPDSTMISLITCRGPEHAGSLRPGRLRFHRFSSRQLRTERGTLVDGIHKPRECRRGPPRVHRQVMSVILPSDLEAIRRFGISELVQLQPE
jgi:hypothetical protein